MDELDFEFHQNWYAPFFNEDNQEDRAHFLKEALQAQIYCVHDALRDAQYAAAVITPDRLTDAHAKYFARYGAGRRFGLLWSAFREILKSVPVDRAAPLSSEEVKSISRDLNTIYINIVGTIDNHAWCLRHERGSERVRAFRESKVGLFVCHFLSDPNFDALRPAVVVFRDWFREIRQRRDPAAHQIPLSVPPAVLSAQAAERYTALESRIGEAWNASNFAQIEELQESRPKELHLGLSQNGA